MIVASYQLPHTDTCENINIFPMNLLKHKFFTKAVLILHLHAKEVKSKYFFHKHVDKPGNLVILFSFPQKKGFPFSLVLFGACGLPIRVAHSCWFTK